MDTNQYPLLAEYEHRQRQDELARAAARHYPSGEPPAGPTLRDALADLLFTLATWVAPEGERKEDARTLARG